MTTLRNVTADLSFAIRLIQRRGGTALLIVTTLAIGIGTATTMFDAVDTILLQPIPVEAPHQVMTLWRMAEPSNTLGTVAPGTIADWRERSTAFSHIAGAEPYSLGYDDGSGPRSIGTWRVTNGFFEILKANPRAGRLLAERDYVDGADPVVVVGHRFWVSKLGARTQAIGTSITLDGTPWSIVGVLPPDFLYVEGRQLYVPRRLTGSWRQNRFADYYLAYGRLSPQTTRQLAETELREIARSTAAEFPASDADLSAAVMPMNESLVSEARPGLLLLLLSALLILLIACVNAGSLLLAEAARRAQELAIRAALGAGRARIVRQVVTESSFIAALAGALGVVIAMGGLAAFRRFAPEDLPRINELGVDLRLIAIGGLVAVLVAVLVALPPAFRVLSQDLHPALKQGARSGLLSPRASRLRGVLVGVQVALAVVLLAGGGLLIRSWMKVTKTDQGYRAENITATEGHIWSVRPTSKEKIAFVDELVDRLEVAPGVRATVVSSLPLSVAIGNEDASVRRPGESTPMAAKAVIAGTDVFPIMGIAVHEGHGIDSALVPGAEPVAVVSQRLRERLWPAEAAVGQLLEVAFNGVTQQRRVIGVVADVRYQSLEQPAEPTVYLPFSQAITGSLYFVIDHPGTPGQASSWLESTIRSIEPSLDLEQSVSLENQVRQAGKARLFSATILAVFAGTSALLTGIGLFGLMAHTVRSTTHELGVRLALGAWPGRLRAALLRRAARLVISGAVVGLGVFLLLSNALRGVLYGVATRDPITLVAVVLTISGVGFLAACVPAQMATRVDPAAALRSD